MMNKSNRFDHKMFRKKFRRIYKNNKYNFQLDNSLISNMISKWKTATNKSSVLYNAKDYQIRQILTDYRSLYIELENGQDVVNIEYIIWGNDENIDRLRKSKHYFIETAYYRPPEFKQLLIIMYKDDVSENKIPGLYILMNNKSEKSYEIVFKSVLNIINKDKEYNLEIKSVVTGEEIELINVVKKVFPNARLISCLFHYKQDIMKNVKQYGLYKREHRKNSDFIITRLSILKNFQYIIFI